MFSSRPLLNITVPLSLSLFLLLLSALNKDTLKSALTIIMTTCYLGVLLFTQSLVLCLFTLIVSLT